MSSAPLSVPWLRATAQNPQLASNHQVMSSASRRLGYSWPGQIDDKSVMENIAGVKPVDETPGADAPPPPGDSRQVERRARSDRRLSDDRRSSLDRRRGPGRRRTDYRRAAEEGHMNEEQLDFLKAVDEYKRVNDRAFPTLTELLDLVLYLGYRKVAPEGEFKLTKGRQTPRRGAAEDAD